LKDKSTGQMLHQAHRIGWPGLLLASGAGGTSSPEDEADILRIEGE
jgi:hypothetical protein